MEKHYVKIEIYISLCVLFLLLCFFNSFNLWSQIIGFYQINDGEMWVDPFVRLYHYPRASLFYPIVAIYRITSLSIDFLFKIYTSIVLILSVYVQYLTLINLFQYKKIVDFLFILILLPFYFVLAQYMNGRLVYAFLGFAILNYILVNHEKTLSLKLFCLYFLSGLMCSVSSGSFLIYTLVLLLHLTYFYSRSKSIFPVLACIFFALPLLLLGVFKNLKFYNYSFFALFDHGFGLDKIVFSLTMFSLLVAFVYLVQYLRYGLKPGFVTVFFCTILVSLFFSMMGKGIIASQIPTLILTFIIIIKFSLKRIYSNTIKSRYNL